ncbi:MAG: hypothetical protein EP330_25410 [Deltaproteobacteria bacterium]|nr:MAG: hypothetical protein EP330_25410 [Deltaproteobacteria bacterium]
MRASALLLLLAGCQATEADQAAWIAPFDGQTGFDPAQDLVVSLRDVHLPDDYDFPALIEVMDLLDGGRVPGTVTRTADELRFTPDAPWESDRRCAWTIYDPYDLPHGPEVHLPVAGTAVFEVSSNIHALDATLGEVEGQVCMLLSRPVEGSVSLTVWDEDAEFAIDTSDEPAEWQDFAIPETDGGAGVRCFDNPSGLAAGDAIRVRIEGSGDVLGQGPWRLELSDMPLVHLLAARRRSELTPTEWGTP